VQLASAQPNESNRDDYKTIWSNDAIKDAAAFANTFGGILIIGVEKNKKDNQAKPVGVASSSALTTGIASAIATNISPTPPYDIAECHEPEEPS
jgi:predicted HTH transcriptional regulator